MTLCIEIDDLPTNARCPSAGRLQRHRRQQGRQCQRISDVQRVHLLRRRAAEAEISLQGGLLVIYPRKQEACLLHKVRFSLHFPPRRTIKEKLMQSSSGVAIPSFFQQRERRLSTLPSSPEADLLMIHCAHIFSERCNTQLLD